MQWQTVPDIIIHVLHIIFSDIEIETKKIVKMVLPKFSKSYHVSRSTIHVLLSILSRRVKTTKFRHYCHSLVTGIFVAGQFQVTLFHQVIFVYWNRNWRIILQNLVNICLYRTIRAISLRLLAIYEYIHLCKRILRNHIHCIIIISWFREKLEKERLLN